MTVVVVVLVDVVVTPGAVKMVMCVLVVVEMEVVVTGGGMDVVVTVVGMTRRLVLIEVVVETVVFVTVAPPAGPTAVMLGSLNTTVSVPSIIVVGTWVMAQLAQGGAEGLQLGTKSVVVCVACQAVVVFLSGPIKIAAVA